MNNPAQFPSQFPEAQSNPDLEQALRLVTSNDDYRVIRRITPPLYHPNHARQPGEIIFALADCEATSADPKTATAIEIGLVKVAFNPKKAGVCKDAFIAIDKLSMLEDPGFPSDPGAQAVHGISEEDLAGQTFDEQEIRDFLEDVDFIIAHNASYDRPVLTRSLPMLDDYKWLCSLREIPWNSMGISSRALEHLIYKAGFFHEGHRAVADCEALLAVLCHRFLDGIEPIYVLGELAQAKSTFILCENAPFDAKDIMKQRGYRWNPGDAGIPVKAWMTPEIHSSEELMNELQWMLEHVYGYVPGRFNKPINVSALPMDASIRYSTEAMSTAFQGRQSIAINQDKADLQTILDRLLPA
jgi:DNA polymerase III subunit epsilon